MSTPLTAQRLDQWISTLEGVLRPDGDLRVARSTGETSERHYVDLQVSAPGFGLPTTSRYRYQEWYRPEGSRWRLDAYAYDYFDLVRGGSRGYHWHPIRRVDPSGAAVYHVKCIARSVRRADDHFRGHRMSLIEARDVFTRIDALGEPISCEGLYPLTSDLA